MPELTVQTIKSRSLQGVVALISRTLVLQVIGFVAMFLLTIYLTPTVFGVYYVVSAFVNFLAYFSDVGLAAALIQKKEALTDDDLSTTFSIQQILVLTVSLVAVVLVPSIGVWYGLSGDGVILLYALIASFFLSSLKTIPSVLLERKLEFSRLVIPQIAETLAFYAVAVMLASRGFEISSFTYAVLARGIVGLIVMYAVSPWRIRISITWSLAKRLMKFGVPFQLNSILALVKDDLMTVFLGKILPFSAIGYIGWAKKWAEVPLRLIMDSMIRVTFPAFSRMQTSKELLGKALNRTFFGLGAAIFPISVCMLFVIRPVVFLIPKYAKWEPALVPFYLYVISSGFAAFTTPLTNTLNAIGKIRTTLAIMVGWTIATWVFTVSFVHFFGFVGVPLTAVVLALSILFVAPIVARHAQFSLWRAIRIPAIGALIQSCVMYGGILLFRPSSLPALVLLCLAGLCTYGVILYAGEKNRIIELHSIWKNKQ